jgi:protein-export membrane protein SecD
VVGRDSDRQIVASVESPAPNRVVVRTRAKNQAESDRDQAVVQSYLGNAYPGVALQVETAQVHHVFVGKAPMGKAGEDYVDADKVKDVVERRLYGMSQIREPVIQTQGDDRVIVELPGVKDPQKVTEILGQTALLEFCLVPDKYEPPATSSEDNNYDTWTNKNTHADVPWTQVYAESDKPFTGANLKPTSKVVPGQGLALVVSFELRDEQTEAFRKFTGHNVGRYMAITLDGVCQMAPVIKSEIPGNGIIEGKFSPDDATKLALLLNAGALPVPLDIAENRTVSATLGADSIHKSLLAGVVGFVLVLAFMILAYRVPGALANIALVLYLILLAAMLKLANATLTLPGVAAFIMSLGMAVDANILIFERLKEELYSGKTSRAAIVAGFDRAWTAILDANVTTLIGASVLYFLGTSSVKSFAVTLFLGVIVHLFTAVTVSRWLVTMFAHTRLGSKLSSYGVPKPE